MPRLRTTNNNQGLEELVNQLQGINVAEHKTLIQKEEVLAVVNHRIKNNKWEFRLKFASGIEWIPQDNCDCPHLINKYLHHKNINTIHLICRVSTKQQTSCESTSLQLQESRLKEAAENLNSDNQIVRIVVHMISGSVYQNIPSKLIEVGETVSYGDTIMVWRIDRLSRNIVKSLSWLEDLNEKGINIIAHQENLTYRDNKLEFIYRIFEAQFEAAKLGSRIKSSYEYRRERGDEAVGRLPWGKKYDRITSSDGSKTLRKVVIDNLEEIMITREIKSSRASYRSVADKLNRERKFKRHKRWTPMMIKRIKERG